jgi:hypothetical protein
VLYVIDDPSSRGELPIQQGELAGRRCRFEAIVCENPTCRCDHVTLECFTEMPEASLRAPIVVCLEMDLERQEITNLQELKADPTARALATAFAAESGEAEWSQLKRIYWELKQYWTEHTDLEQVEFSFPPEALSGAMVGYPDVFPFARRLEFTHAQEPWLSDDQYCCSPKMPVPGSRSLVYSTFPASGTGTPAADPVVLLPISRGQGGLGRSRKEPSVFRTGLVEIVEECPSRLRFAACQAAGIAQAVVWPYREKADASARDAQNWSQRPLPLRQWQEVEKMLRSLI